jgi:hypothetical protein
MKTFSRILISTGLLWLAGRSCLAVPLDPRLTLISAADLRTSISQTPLSSPKQLRLISRARSSHLAEAAYAQYKMLCSQHPKDADANLLAGIAADNDWEEQRDATASLPPTPAQLAVLAEARLFLSKAVELSPTSAQANMEYGYYLWQSNYSFGGSGVNQGYLLVQKAVNLSPKAPTFHAALGNVCANPYVTIGNHYNAKRAYSEYRTAIALDPLYAYPHLQIVFLDMLLNKYADARVQMTAYLNLSPPDVAHEKIVKILQNAIQKEIGKG